MKKLIKLFSTLSAVMLLFVTGGQSVSAAVTPLNVVPYRGVLRDMANNPVSSLSTMRICLFTAETGGSATYFLDGTIDGADDNTDTVNDDCGESLPISVTPNSNGEFSVLLGDTASGYNALNGIDLTTNTYYMEFIVNGYKLAPRQRVGSSFGTLGVVDGPVDATTIDASGAVDLDDTLHVTGAVGFDSTLDVTGGALLMDDLTVNGDATVDGQLTALDLVTRVVALNGATTENEISITDNVANALSITNGAVSLMVFDTTTGNESVAINPDVTMSADAGVGGDLSVTGTLDATGATTLGDTLDVAGATTLNSTLDVVGVNATTLGGTLDVTGATTLNDTLDVTGTTTLAALDITGAVDFADTLTVDGATTLNNTLDVLSDTTIGGTFDVLNSMATNLSGTLEVVGTTILDDTLEVIGATILDDTLEVVGATTLDDTLDVAGDTSIGGTFDVLNAMTTTLSGTLEVVGTTALDSALEVYGTATLYDTLNVFGVTTIDDTLDVTGNTSVGGTFDVLNSMATTLSGTLNVTGDTTLAILNATGAVDFADTLDVVGATTLDSTLDVVGNATVGGTLDVTGIVTLVDDLDVGGDLSVTGAFDTVSLNVEALAFDGVSGDNALIMPAGAADALSITDGTSDLMVFDTSADTLTVSPNADLDGTLHVSGAVGFDDILDVTGGALFFSTVTANGAVDFDDTLEVAGATTLLNTLEVVGANATNLGGTLVVDGATTINNTLEVAGVYTTTLGGDLNVAGDLGVTGAFSVASFDVNELNFNGGIGANELVMPDGIVDALSIVDDSANDLMVFDTSADTLTISPAVTMSSDLTVGGTFTTGAFGLEDLTFTGVATGDNTIVALDNVADGLSITDGVATSLMTFDTTDAAEGVNIGGYLNVGGAFSVTNFSVNGLTFDGVDGANEIDLTEDLGDALSITDGVVTLVDFVTTIGFKAVNINVGLNVLGDTTLAVLNATGAVDFDSTLNVDGDATFNANVVADNNSYTACETLAVTLDATNTCAGLGANGDTYMAGVVLNASGVITSIVCCEL